MYARMADPPAEPQPQAANPKKEVQEEEALLTGLGVTSSGY
jgi:hypothetical protein